MNISAMMKSWIWSCLLVIITLSAAAKPGGQYARFSLAGLEEEETCNGIYTWTINGVQVPPGTQELSIRLHKTGFDTIVLYKGSPAGKRVILTRFSANHHYRLIPESCCHDADIHDTGAEEKYEPLWAALSSDDQSYDREMEIISLLLKENHGKVVFSVKNADKGAQYGVTFGAPHVNATGGRIWTGNKNTVLDTPFLTESSGYFFQVTIGQFTARHIDEVEFGNAPLFFQDENTQQAWVLEKEYVTYEYRFFRQETLFVTCDGASGKISIRVKR